MIRSALPLDASACLRSLVFTAARTRATVPPALLRQTRRAFITALLGPSERKYHERRTFNFSPSIVYGAISQVQDYKEFVPWCIGSNVLLRKDDYMEAELVVGFQLLSESYISRVTLEPERRITAVAADTQLFRHLQNEWLVEPGRIPGTTDVTFRIDFAFRSALHARAAALFHEEVASKMVDAYVKRCATLTASKKPFDARGVSFDHSTASTLLRSTSARGEGLHELHREFGRASFGPTVILAAAERRTFSIATSAAPANGKVGPPSAVRPIAPPKSPSSRPMSGGGGSPLARTLTSPSSTSTSSHTASEKKRPVLPLTPSPW